MRLAHLADLHLGFRQFSRLNPAGLNQREADVANAFRAAIDGVILKRPDAILIAGDLFHQVRPSNVSIVFAFQQISRLQAALPGVPIIVVGGNHDTPRSAESGNILRLYEEMGVLLATSEPRRFSFPELDLSVLAVPEPCLDQRPPLLCEGPERYQVLLLHGEVEGILGPYGQKNQQIPPGKLLEQPWNYVALGHYHVTRELAPHIWYAGGIEYTTSNIWGEREEEAQLGLEGKAWLLVDLEAKTVERQPLQPSRPIYSPPIIDAEGLSASELDRLILESLQAAPGGIAGAIVRLRFANLPKHVVADLNHEMIRKFKGQALEMVTVYNAPDRAAATERLREKKGVSLEQQFLAFLEARELPAQLDREQFVSAGMAALAEIDKPDEEDKP